MRQETKYLSYPLPHIQNPTSTVPTKSTKQQRSKTKIELETSPMATTLLHQPIPPFLTSSPLISSSQQTSLSFNPNPSEKPVCYRRPTVAVNLKKKNRWLDPFDYGDEFEMPRDSLFSEGKQDEDPRPPDNPDNPYGFLKFPSGFNVEIASLGSKLRKDVRRCCCVVAGGVYENLLFFPAIQLIKDRYPGVQVDTLTSARGKQVYELNKNVRWANAYDLDNDFPDPGEYTFMTGLLKSRYYDMVLSTKLAGMGHAAFLFMTTAEERVSYIYPNVNAAGAGLMLSETFTPDRLNLSEGGYHMYEQMLDWLGRPRNKVPRHPVPPLKISISRKLKEVVELKYKNSGVEKGKYVVVHGIECDSQASMQSRGDTDSLLPIHVWSEITKGTRVVKPLFVIPHEKIREDVEEIVGEDASIVFITTPGQLAALINDSAGVIATNTAAIQLANAREKPSVALFSSEEKGRVFVPDAEKKRCTIIASKTGKLIDIDTDAVQNAMQIFEGSLVLV